MSDRVELYDLGGVPEFELSPCAQEPIHSPGAIQPHGAVLAGLLDSGLVTHASANLMAILGLPAEAVLGQSLTKALGETAGRLLQGVISQDGATLGQMHFLQALHGSLSLQGHRAGRYICVDIEPVRHDSGPKQLFTIVQTALETFRQATTRTELCELAVRALKTITGYDRVMAYRFGDDGHGEVIAEARLAQLDPYLGLRYPATDIPPQARRLYLRKRVGAIADSSYGPVPLISDHPLDEGEPLDLTHSALRSVSPIHREYMRNMKTAASLTVGLSHGETLWGMLVCHHATARIAGPELRAAADMIGQVVSLLLGSLGEAEVYAQQIERAGVLRALISRLAVPMPLPEALAAAEAELLDLVNAEGAIVRLSGSLFCLGRTPPSSAAERALALLWPDAAGEALAVDDLGLRHLELASCTSKGSGALLLPIALDTDDAILWFRPELSRTVLWGGNPTEHAISDPVTGRLSPRASFAAWKETVRGRSAPWTKADLALARDLRSAIEAEMAQRTKAELARLRYYDSLTGLPNRSMLQERLVEAEHEGGGKAALLFLDLDRFKAVNDTMGHAAGDALLVEVARRLLAAAGPENLAARLGGDEFVVLCRGLDHDAVISLGERIRQGIEAPFDILGRQCHVSASIGFAAADQSGGLDLVRAADMAMYVAKQCGGNRGIMFEPSLYDRAARLFELDQELRVALSSSDQLVLLYQPLFRLVSGVRQLFGFEALLRWRHPRHGWMAPKLFIPLAEKSGLMLPLGEWVLAQALRQGLMLQQVCQEVELRLSVNVSASQLAQPGFCSNLADTLQAEGFPPPALCLDVAESILADVAGSYVLTDVRKLGVQVAIDDFGMGYSSLSYLLRLPVDVVKLDRSFLEEVDRDTRGASFVGAVVALAHAAGKSVVLDGIETEAQFDIASAASADLVQGFLFAPPLSANAAMDLAARPASKS
jgi:diguanylate cyclase (GGDEF)-like protein